MIFPVFYLPYVTISYQLRNMQLLSAVFQLRKLGRCRAVEPGRDLLIRPPGSFYHLVMTHIAMEIIIFNR